MIIEKWFPTSIAVIENVVSNKEHSFLKNKLVLDKDFKNLIQQTGMHTNNFARTMGSYNNYFVRKSWYTIYTKGDFQEYHEHENSVFSSVYCFTNPKNSGSLIFRNPVKDMLPMGRLKPNEYSFYNILYDLKPGQLIIFRSYLAHSVSLCKNKSPRITMASNLS